jgi:hypothetical protein
MKYKMNKNKTFDSNESEDELIFLNNMNYQS